MRDRRDIEDLKAAAHAQTTRVLGALGIRERPNSRGLITMCNPKREDKNPSFAIWTHGGTLSWKDLVPGVGKGDVIDLVAYMKDWTHLEHRGRAEAMRWLRDLLGLRNLSPAQRQVDADAARAVAVEAAKQAEADEEDYRRWARGLFFNALDPAGTPGETYLRERRGIDINNFPRGPKGGDRTPKFLRFIPRLKHIGAGGDVTFWPCLLACCVEPATGRVRAIHRTWLALDGRDKAPVAPARKVAPSFEGLIIPVWKGDTGLTVREAIGCGLREELGLTEGWEDGLSWAYAVPARRVWAAISLSNMGNVILPECIDAVYVHRQNDWENNFAASRAFELEKAKLERQGRFIGEMRATWGKDLSDTLTGRAA